MTESEKGGAFILAAAIVVLAIWAGGIYVAIHFIGKYW